MARILELTLNGRPRVDAVPDNLLLLDYLRETSGLTGTKTGCDGGECGACTVLVDDRPTLSCLTLAATVAGRRVDTVESLGTDGRLSAVQRGFHEKLGAAMRLLHAGIHHGVGRPAAAQSAVRASDEIREALGSNICRCTGYVKIIEAVQYAAELHAAGVGAVNEIVPAHNIGAYVPMVDGPEKVVGPGQVHRRSHPRPACWPGASIRSPYSHAEILEVDVSEALKVPGVKAIVTGADCDKTFGVLPIARSEHPLARDKVRYRGEPVAAVAAVDDATARARRCGLIRLKVRELPAYYTVAGRRWRRAPCSMHAQKPATSSATCCSSSAASSRASPRPIWCARAPTIAPRCARTRWRCTPRSPNTTPCASA